MQKAKSNHRKKEKLLAALVMGINLVNTVAPVAAAGKNAPKQMEPLTIPPQNEAKTLEYTVLPQALQCVESVVFGKAEAKDYAARKVDKIERGDVMIISKGQIGSAGISEGWQEIFDGGSGIVDNSIEMAMQRIFSGGSGFISNQNGICGQEISDGGIGSIAVINSGRQEVLSGGSGIVDTLNGNYAYQFVSAGAVGKVNLMNTGNPAVYGNGTGTIITMNAGRQDIFYDGGTGIIENMHGGSQVIYDSGCGVIGNMNHSNNAQVIKKNGVGKIHNLNLGRQDIYKGGTGIISAVVSSGYQNIYNGGTGIISAIDGVGRQNVIRGVGTILKLNNVSSFQEITNGGTSLNTTIFNGQILLENDKCKLVNTTVHGGEIRFADFFFHLKGGENYSFSGDFSFDGGTVNLTKDWRNNNLVTYKNLQIESLKKGGGDFVMMTDLESEKDGDKLIIDDADAGTSYIKVLDKSLYTGPTVSENKKLLLVTVKNGKADFVGKELNKGGAWSVMPEIKNGSELNESDKEWYLTNITKKVNKDTKVLLESSDNAYALWRSTNDSLRKRLGEMRLRSKAANSDGIWARYNGGKFASDSFSGSYNMYQLGYDKADNAKSIYGFALEKGSGKGSYSFGSGKDKLFAGSLYGVWTGEDGSYTDVTAKVGQFSSDVKSHGDYPDKADYKNRAYSLSVEYGKTIELNEGAGMFIEPQVQFITGHMASTEYTTDRGNNVYLGAVNSYIGRLGFVLGQKAEDGNEVYVKASALHEFGGDRDVRMKAANGEKMSLKKEYKDTWFELGLGTNIKLSKAGYFYGDVERSFGAEIKKKWQLNAGVRFSF